MKKNFFLILSLVIAVGTVAGCQNRAANTELDVLRAKAQLEEQNKALARRFLEGLDGYRIEIFDEVFSSEARIYFPGTFEPLSIDQVKSLVSGFYDAFDNMDHNVQDLFADGDKVLARTRNSITHSGEFAGIAPTGKVIQLDELLVFRIEQGMIVELWIQEDFVWMYQQLGMELKPVTTPSER